MHTGMCSHTPKCTIYSVSTHIVGSLKCINFDKWLWWCTDLHLLKINNLCVAPVVKWLCVVVGGSSLCLCATPKEYFIPVAVSVGRWKPLPPPRIDRAELRSPVPNQWCPQSNIASLCSYHWYTGRLLHTHTNIATLLSNLTMHQWLIVMKVL